MPLNRATATQSGITLVVALWTGALGLLAASGPSATPRQPVTTVPTRAAVPRPASRPAIAPVATPQASDVAGTESCIGCHDSEGKSLDATLHGKAQNPRTPAGKGQACESCHGPGKAHADDPRLDNIRRFTPSAGRDASATCLTCHDRGAHAQWNASAHNARNVSCTTCHSAHRPKSPQAQLKTASVTETCATCHKTQAFKARRSGHMPLREGKMDCVSCHNPHGSTNVKLLKVGNWVNESCLSCHTEKRGPFLWEHAAGRESCVSCHDAHGSNHDRMLVAKTPMLCQRCHIGSRHPSTIYDGAQLANRSNRLVSRGCVNCHQQIHGSNSPSGNLFLR